MLRKDLRDFSAGVGDAHSRESRIPATQVGVSAEIDVGETLLTCGSLIYIARQSDFGRIERRLDSIELAAFDKPIVADSESQERRRAQGPHILGADADIATHQAVRVQPTRRLKGPVAAVLQKAVVAPLAGQL